MLWWHAAATGGLLLYRQLNLDRYACQVTAPERGLCRRSAAVLR